MWKKDKIKRKVRKSCLLLSGSRPLLSRRQGVMRRSWPGALKQRHLSVESQFLAKGVSRFWLLGSTHCLQLPALLFPLWNETLRAIQKNCFLAPLFYGSPLLFLPSHFYFFGAPSLSRRPSKLFFFFKARPRFLSLLLPSSRTYQ